MACCIPQRIINPKYKKYCKVYDNNQFDDLVQIGVRNLIHDLKNHVLLKDSKWNIYSTYIFKSDIFQYEDRDDFYIDVPCGRCINCLRSRQTMWRIRLLNEYYYMSSDARANSYFVTLTIEPKYYDMIYADTALYVRRFLDRVRKACGSSPRHFIVTEFGDTTDRYHLHGIFFDYPADIHDLYRHWKYGFVKIRQLSERRCNYITSYITKHNQDLIIEPKYVEKLFVSPGLGRCYCDDPYNHIFHRRHGEPIPVMLNDSGFLQLMPKYFRTKIFTPEELDDLKIAYFANMSEDVVPDPPYRIGSRTYDDYTLYLKDCKQLLYAYNSLYNKNKQFKKI